MNLQDIEVSQAVEFHNKLNQDIWDQEDLRLDVAVALLRIARKFIEFLDIKDLKIVDVILTGSMCSYAYTEHSDLDLHILVDAKGTECETLLANLFTTKKTLWNQNHPLTVKGYDVELYVQDVAEPHVSSGTYSLLHTEWITKPKKREVNVDHNAVIHKYRDYSNQISHAIDSNNKVLMEQLKAKIKDMRQAGLRAHGEFGVENLVFKLLRARGDLDRLFAAVTSKEDEELILDDVNLTEVLKQVKGRWALVSKKTGRPLAYYRGPKGQRPSAEWVKQQERRIHAFSKQEQP